MPDARHGFATAFTGFVMGLVIETMLRSFVSAEILDPSMLIVYQLVNILTILTFVHVTHYWGYSYLFGWWFGLGTVYYAGLIGTFEFSIYSLVLLFVLLTRVLRRAGD